MILAGGKSSRMGRDKGLIEWKNKPWVLHVINAVEPLCSEIFIATNAEEYSTFGYHILKDKKKGQGPMEGLVNSFNYCSTPYLLVLSCDIPLIDTSVLQKLCKNELKEHIRIFNVDDHLQPLTALYHSSSFSKVMRSYHDGELSITKAIKPLDKEVLTVKDKDKHYFSNINYPKDLNTLK